MGVTLLVQLSREPRLATQYSVVFDPEGQELTLPQRWLGSGQNLETKSFHLEFNLGDKIGEEYQLYIPFYEQQIDIFLNGIRVSLLSQTSPWKGPLSAGAVIVPLPSKLLNSGPNALDIQISTDKIRFGALSRLYVGEGSELQRHFSLRFFIEQNLKIIVFSVQAFLAILSFVFSIARPQDRRFIWLGIAMFSSCLFSVGVFSDAFEQLVDIVPWAFLLASSTGFAFLGFIYEIENNRPLKGLAALTVFAPLISLLVVVVGWFDFRHAVLTLSVPAVAVGLMAASISLLVSFWKSPTVDRAFLLSGLLLMLGAIGHDVLLRLDIINAGILISQPARLLTLSGLAIFLMLHLARLTSELDQASITLSEKLKKREDELATAFSREKAIAEKLASQTERGRIMAELHDGVAGHLSTIVALSDLGSSDQSGIQTVARHALAELRMVIDTLVLPDGDLLMTLASFRERSVAPLSRLGITVHWSMMRLPEIRGLSSDDTLSILRILQEIVSNAVRHGHPKEICIEGEEYGSGHFVIRVTNTGGKPLVLSYSEVKYGLRSVEARSEELGGYTKLLPLTDGAEFELILPFVK